MKTEEGKRCLLKRVGRIREDLEICANEYPKEAMRSGDNSLFSLKQTINAVLDELNDCRIKTRSYGPRRDIYDASRFLVFPIFNSKDKEGQFRDERHFVQIKNILQPV